MKYISIILFFTLLVSCNSTKQSFYKTPVLVNGVYIVRAFTYNNPNIWHGNSQPGYKNVALEMYIEPDKWITETYIEEGRIGPSDGQEWGYLDNNGVLQLNHLHRTNSKDSIKRMMLFDEVKSSTNLINLSYYDYAKKQYIRINEDEIPLGSDELPFTRINKYKERIIGSITNCRTIRKLDVNHKIVQLSNSRGNYASKAILNLSGEEISLDTISYDKFFPLSFSGNYWLARSKCKKPKYCDLILGHSTDINNPIDTIRTNGISSAHPLILSEKKILFIERSKTPIVWKYHQDSISQDSALSSIIQTKVAGFNSMYYRTTYDYKGYPALILDDELMIFKPDGSYEFYKVDLIDHTVKETIAINNKGFYFIKNKELYYHNYINTTKVNLTKDLKIEKLMYGPNDCLLLHFNGNNNPDYIGGIYEETSGQTHLISIHRLHNRMYFGHLRHISYWENRNSILFLFSDEKWRLISLHEIKNTGDNTGS